MCLFGVVIRGSGSGTVFLPINAAVIFQAEAVALPQCAAEKSIGFTAQIAIIKIIDGQAQACIDIGTEVQIQIGNGRIGIHFFFQGF